jgi:hypothetical protein
VIPQTNKRSPKHHNKHCSPTRPGSRSVPTTTPISTKGAKHETERQCIAARTALTTHTNNMHFSARSALIVSSCLALGVRALPVTYSVVDVDGGSAAAAAPTPTAGSGSGTSSSESSADQPATIYVTKSTEIEEPEATTVSVSITIVETKHAMPKPTSVSSSFSASSSPSPSEASAQAPSTTLTPSSTDALSVLSSAQSTLMTSHTKPGPSPSSAPQSCRPE